LFILFKQASANGHDLVVDVLLRNNAKITIKDSRQATPLHHAAQRGYTEIAKKLLHAGSDVNARG
jgi:ankyrin repeat protein